MKRTFRILMVWAALTGAIAGAGFGLGFAYGRGKQPTSNTGLTAQQVQQIVGGSVPGNLSNLPAPPAGAPFGPPP